MPIASMKIILLFLIPILVLGFWFVANSRAATETPDYVVVRADGAYEIRDYPELTLATTPMAADGVNGGFGELFRFITGSNETQEKISMTSPVLIDNTQEKKTMSFIMPPAHAAKGLPKPKGEKVSLSKLPASRLAVLSFKGGRSVENESKAVTSLRTWLEKQKLKSTGQPIFAYYDPPWTPVPLRRNEVMIPIEKGS